ncbi:hypothetical protein ACFCY9_18050 [Streptomyces fimicarius]|uniref:hypothetical protein n=1 Tax=Streptomyces griseus TaxID=1911 RepID=UPI0035D73ECC
MMIDYNVSDHWSADDPDWLKSLVSSLDRGHGVSTVVPLTVLVEETLQWVELASGVDAWKNAANRRSLELDLNESVGALGTSLRAHIAAPLGQFRTAFSQLIGSPAQILKQPPGTRTDACWTNVTETAKDLLEALATDEAVRSSWDDLVATAQDRTLEGREYRPIAELLFDQVRKRGLNADRIFRDMVSIVAFGRAPPRHAPWPEERAAAGTDCERPNPHRHSGPSRAGRGMARIPGRGFPAPFRRAGVLYQRPLVGTQRQPCGAGL